MMMMVLTTLFWRKLMLFVSRSLCEGGEEKSEYEFLQGLNGITGGDKMFRERKEMKGEVKILYFSHLLCFFSLNYRLESKSTNTNGVQIQQLISLHQTDKSNLSNSWGIQS
jgi:hypothetical protein